ncbi:type IV pilus assembly protein PilV [Luteibacter rhizovicinus]|uniref:Type IV pilus assembly protein PilV n=1 Tax=Luteibacter rhizovicinus TaxID=242606 RepID=A0A4R3YYS1_9GAMM|nr:type IV pilus modification protein PilV [Luteibacter rhizovicinus]TCV97028.1 type IV pilus assembly protein PilV [Luteibacter rhizovicinus]
MAQGLSLRVQRGVSLIEVLMAVLIFCIGLIGLAGLLVMATKSNHSAYIRTQVTFLANSMADRMRANPVGLWTLAYNDTAYPVSGTPDACDATTGCNPAKVALRDKIIWSQQLTQSLPGVGPTSIKCVSPTTGSVPAAPYATRPPYGGSCTMTIQWAERGITGADDKIATGSLQSFTWVFQP